MTRQAPPNRRYPPEELLDWTPRQQQVLELIARGKSNPEIAEELGLSLEGAKWHIREIMSKLDIDNRADAAEYWRWRTGLPGRVRRAFGGVLAAVPLKWTAGMGSPWVAGAIGAGIAGLGGLVVLTLVLASGSDPTRDRDAQPYPLSEVSEDVLALKGLQAQSWTGPTEGLLSEDEAVALGSQRGKVAEVALVELSSTGVPEDARHGYVLLYGGALDAAAGPVWAVVFADRPSSRGLCFAMTRTSRTRACRLPAGTAFGFWMRQTATRHLVSKGRSWKATCQTNHKTGGSA